MQIDQVAPVRKARADEEPAVQAKLVQLVREIAQAWDDTVTKSDREEVRGIEQRALLFEELALLAQLPALRTLQLLPGDGLRNLAMRLDALRRQDLMDLVPAQASIQWAEVDARAFRTLEDHTWREDAAIAIAQVARGNTAYRSSLTERAPDTAAWVQALDAANWDRIAAKEDRKAAECTPSSPVADDSDPMP